MKLSYLLPLVALSAFFGSCTKEEEAVVEVVDKSPLDAFYATEAPANPKQISEVFADPTPGREVVLAGEVMGAEHPFVDGRAMVILGDPTKLTPCNRIPGDENCPTPWDNCCDDLEMVKASITTVQILDKDGAVLKAKFKGYKGIKELSFVTVKGTIAEGSNAQNLLINVTSFNVAAESPYKDAKPVRNYEF